MKLTHFCLITCLVSLVSLSVNAQSPGKSKLMNSLRSTTICQYTVPSDYTEVQDKKNIDVDIREFLVDTMLQNKGCYIYYVPAQPGTYITAIRNSNVTLRWSTRDEISYALANLDFKELSDDGIARARLDSLSKKHSN
jgi:hypothetical protein